MVILAILVILVIPGLFSTGQNTSSCRPESPRISTFAQNHQESSLLHRIATLSRIATLLYPACTTVPCCTCLYYRALLYLPVLHPPVYTTTVHHPDSTSTCTVRCQEGGCSGLRPALWPALWPALG